MIAPPAPELVPPIGRPARMSERRGPAGSPARYSSPATDSPCSARCSGRSDCATASPVAARRSSPRTTRSPSATGSPAPSSRAAALTMRSSPSSSHRLGRYDRNLRSASKTSSSRSTTWSMRPVISACRRQPPSSSRSTFSPSAIEQARAGDGDRRAFLHHREIGEAHEPRRRAERRPERGGGERRLAHAPELRVVVAEQLPHAARAHRVGQPRAGRFADDDERHAALGGGALHVRDFLAVGRAGGRAFHREVVDDDRDVAAVDPAVARDLAVGRRLVGLLGIDAGSAEKPGFDERVLVEQAARCARARSACPRPCASRTFPPPPGERFRAARFVFARSASNDIGFPLSDSGLASGDPMRDSPAISEFAAPRKTERFHNQEPYIS